MTVTASNESRRLWVLLLAVCLAYLGVWRAGFVYEDAQWMPVLTTVSAAGLAALTNAPWQFAAWLGAGQPWAYHLVVVGVHVLNVGLLYAIVRKAFGQEAAFVAAALFGLHPINVEAVAYVSGGREVIAAACLLIGVWAFVGHRRVPWRLGLGCLAWGCAVWAKPSAYVAVALVPFAVLVLEGDAYTAKRVAPWILGVAMLCGGLAVMTLRQRLQFDEHVIYVGLTGWHRYAAVTSAALLRYLALLPVPAGFSVDRDWRGVAGIWTTLSGLGVLALALVAWMQRRTWPVFALTVAWVLLALAPRFVIQQEEVLNEHQLYVPLLAVWTAIGIGWVPACAALSARLQGVSAHVA